MPRHRNFKNILVEAVVFIGLLALVGHLGINFWERFIIQSELTQMKTSLHSLKKTLTNIGTAYDNLHKEIKGLVDHAEEKHYPARFESLDDKWKPKMLDRRRLHDIQVKALLLAKQDGNAKVDKMTENLNPKKINKTTEDKVVTQNKNLEAIMKFVNQGKNATTITRYPPKSACVGQDEDQRCHVQESCRYKNTVSNGHKCIRNDEYRLYHPCNNWKY